MNAEKEMADQVCKAIEKNFQDVCASVKKEHEIVMNLVKVCNDLNMRLFHIERRLDIIDQKRKENGEISDDMQDEEEFSEEIEGSPSDDEKEDEKECEQQTINKIDIKAHDNFLRKHYFKISPTNPQK